MKVSTKQTIGIMVATLSVLALPVFAREMGENYRERGGMREGIRNNVSSSRGMMGEGASNSPVMSGVRPVVMGSVTQIMGTSITVAAMQIGTTTAATAYTVDASHAIIMKDRATSTLAAVAVGDVISVQGSVQGSSVVATTIWDGMGMRMMGSNSSTTSKTASWEEREGKRSGHMMGSGEASSDMATVSSENRGFFTKISGFFSGLFGK